MASYYAVPLGWLRPGLVLALVAIISGCASLSKDAGFGDIQADVRERLGHDVQWVRDAEDRRAIDELIRTRLASELSLTDAVQIALLNNPGLQATYAELGIAEADLVQASRLRNPGFTFTRLERAGELDIERQFLFDVLGLLTLPTRSQIEARRFELAKLRVSNEILQVIAQTRRAYYQAIAAQQRLQYLEDVNTAAEASAELASRMASVGNWSRLQQARQQLFYSESIAQLAQGRQQALAAREQLTRLLGLTASDKDYQLAERLPALPSQLKAARDVEHLGIEQRLDIRMARIEVEGLAKSLGLTRSTRFVNVLEASYLRNSASGEPRQSGYEVELQIPLFDFGSAKVAKAEAIYMQAVNRVREIAVNAQSDIRVAYADYRTAYDIARHYRDEIVPLSQRIADENLLRYNGMLIDVFELLAESRAQVASVNAYLQALRDFWLAETALEMAMLSGRETVLSGVTDGAMPTLASPAGGH